MIPLTRSCSTELNGIQNAAIRIELKEFTEKLNPGEGTFINGDQGVLKEWTPLTDSRNDLACCSESRQELKRLLLRKGNPVAAPKKGQRGSCVDSLYDPGRFN